ncbi:hypothetical protein [Bacillus sp. Marseille-P3661]|uniref:hypothetical protein n=1 Tax=Bacillus sp. Marseille-P3661 TaxID=1936234 RepID=UPI001156FD62|nr:hypothetical protein [Bacillus sp. Marseille-P3661]
MNRILVFIISLSLLFTITAGCSGEGINLNEQKQIQFSLIQKGSSENWEVIDTISGDYYNLEKIYQSTHTLEIKPKNKILDEEITVSIKVNGETLKYLEKRPEGELHSRFKVQKDSNGDYKIIKEFSHFDDNETFWDEDVNLVIEHGNIWEEINLR